MIRGLGLDIVDLARIGEVIARQPRFLARILTTRELEQTLSPVRIAGRWAAKEAVAKAVGAHLTWHDVEIFNDEVGVPRVWVHGIARPDLWLSITHERGHAAAVVVWESAD